MFDSKANCYTICVVNYLVDFKYKKKKLYVRYNVQSEEPMKKTKNYWRIFIRPIGISSQAKNMSKSHATHPARALKKICKERC